MKRIRELLEGLYNYNLRERANVYMGVVTGALAPIVVGRYVMSPSSFEGENSAIAETAAWATSVAINGVVSVCAKGFPLFYTAVTGARVGRMCAEQLKKARLERILETKG